MEYRSYRDTDCRPSLLGLGCMRLPTLEPGGTAIDYARAGALVDEAVRGQGVGGELLAAAKRWARNRRLEYLELNVLAQNENAIRLYESQDFVEATKVMRCML